MTRTVSTRELNRALLARQGLLERSREPVDAVLERLIGMQAQEPPDPYVGLFARLADFDPEELSRRVADRRAVRVSLMRGTIHLVTAADCLALRPVVQSVHERTVQSQFRRQLEGVDLGALRAAGRELLHGGEWAGADLGRALAPRWPEHDPWVLQVTVRYLETLVQVPPRGLWGRSGRALHVLAEDWLGAPPGTDPDPAAALLRYLAAFGPASVADMRVWCGVSGLRAVVERLRPQLEVHADERGRELFDVPGGRWADPAAPAPVRFLPQYDNALLSHEDRARVVPPGLDWDARVGNATFLVDGFVRGTYKRDRRTGVIHVKPFTPLAPAERRAVEAEAGALLGFLGGAGDVELVEP